MPGSAATEKFFNMHKHELEKATREQEQLLEPVRAARASRAASSSTDKIPPTPSSSSSSESGETASDVFISPVKKHGRLVSPVKEPVHGPRTGGTKIRDFEQTLLNCGLPLAVFDDAVAKVRPSLMHKDLMRQKSVMSDYWVSEVSDLYCEHFHVLQMPPAVFELDE